MIEENFESLNLILEITSGDFNNIDSLNEKLVNNIINKINIF